jgi:hypothetical protein
MHWHIAVGPPLPKATFACIINPTLDLALGSSGNDDFAGKTLYRLTCSLSNVLVLALLFLAIVPDHLVLTSAWRRSRRVARKN